MMAGQTPILDQFLQGVAELIQNRDGAKLQDYLQIEPPLSDIYQRMIQELRQRYQGTQGEHELQQRCEGLVPRTKGSSSWTAFPTFMKLYFTFMRDVNVDNLLETYNLLKGLLKYVAALKIPRAIARYAHILNQRIDLYFFFCAPTVNVSWL